MTHEEFLEEPHELVDWFVAFHGMENEVKAELEERALNKKK